MLRRSVVVALLVLTPTLAGCTAVQDFFDQVTAPAASVKVTPLEEGAVNSESSYAVQVTYTEPLSVRIEAVSSDGRTVTALSPAEDAVLTEQGTWQNEAVLELADGTWTITLYVDGHKWTTLRDVTIDTIAPEVHGLETRGDAVDGAFTIGAEATADPDGILSVVRQPDGQVVASSLPYTVTGLADGIHVYDITIQDEAGNRNVYTVQVRAGSATFLPDGAYTVGIVARYDNDLRIWDISQPGSYLTPAAARAETGDAYLGSGFRIDPDEPLVQDVVADVVEGGMTTLQAAHALYQWMYDNLEYDVERLSAQDLLDPGETIEHGGGVCRDLAALYTSLLRAAGIPARVITGYLGGDVNGFHAWVEFYGGDVAGNPSPWIPVDVSAVGRSDVEGDDLYNEEVMLQAFAIQRPDYLTLRNLPPEAEVDGWATAISTTAPQGTQVTFEKLVVPEHSSTVERPLCVDLDDHVRFIAAHPSGCDGLPYIPGYPAAAQQVLDYGVTIDGRGSVTVEMAYPFLEDQPGSVDLQVYGPPERDQERNPDSGKVTVRTVA